VTRSALAWQSKLVLLFVLPFVGTDLVLETNFWFTQDKTVAIWTLGLSALLALVTWKVRAATSQAALAGAAITANLMFSTVTFPYQPWHTAMVPVLGVSLLAFAATRIGRSQKERLGTAEARKGRSAAQIAANLGIAALIASDVAQIWAVDHSRLVHGTVALFAAGLAALAEAAADTVSSEMGQVFGGPPLMITTLRRVEPGRDGAVSLVGTLAGIAAGAVIAGLGMVALRGDAKLFVTATLGGVFGLLFDSLLGATLEARGWLNNDAVNFLSTASAAGFALVAGAVVG
jgi:uncharacterized protein (TIGR00297 family)